MTEAQTFSAVGGEPAQRLDVCRALFEVSPVATMIADDQGRYIDANPAACRLFDVPREHLIGRLIKDFVWPEARGFETVWLAFRAHKSQTGEFVLMRPGGRQLTVRFHAVADFVPGFHVSFLEDISERSSRLDGSDAHFTALADSLAIMIWAEDADGRVQYSNRHWFEYTGLPPLPPGAPGLQEWQVAAHPDDLQTIAGFVERARETGENFQVTLRLRRHDGVYRTHSCITVPIRDGTGRVVRRLGSATDIQGQRDAIEALKHERDLRERFVASLSHDLRSPLTAAKMGAQLLTRNTDHPERLPMQTSRVIRNIDRADQLIQNLLDVTRISAGEPLHLERCACDIVAILREVLDDQGSVHGDRFAVHAPPSVAGFYDESALRRIFENLIGNAVKYAEPNTKVTVTITEPPAEVHLSVHNEGPPIPTEDHASIFQPYQRASGGTQRSVGWGLGLTAVRGLAEAHGGRVQVESTQERGTTFTVILPRTAPPA